MGASEDNDQATTWIYHQKHNLEDKIGEILIA